MWVKIWACLAGDRSNPETNYVWFERYQTDEVLEDEAREYLDSIPWIRESERSNYGFERVDVLPESVRRQMVEEYEGVIHKAKAMLARLNHLPPPEVTETRSRFDRELEFKT